LVGSGDVVRGSQGTAFAEKGRREEMRDDTGGGSGGVSQECGAHDGFEVVNKELFSQVSKRSLTSTATDFM